MRRGQLELLRQNVGNILIMSEVLLLCRQFWHNLAIIAVSLQLQVKMASSGDTVTTLTSSSPLIEVITLIIVQCTCIVMSMHCIVSNQV